MHYKILLYYIYLYTIIELVSFAIDNFYIRYCRPIDWSLNTLLVRAVSSQSATCTKLNNLHIGFQNSNFVSFKHILESYA